MCAIKQLQQFGILVVCLVFIVSLTSHDGQTASHLEGVFYSDGYSNAGLSTPRRELFEEQVWLSPVDGVNNNMGYGYRTGGASLGAMQLGPTSGELAAGQYYLFNFWKDSFLPFMFDIVTIPGGASVFHHDFSATYDYTCMTHSPEVDWVAPNNNDPWIWGGDFWQTFIPTSTHINSAAVRLVLPNTTLLLSMRIVQVTGNAPYAWPPVSPVRTRPIPSPDTHLFMISALWHSNEMHLTPGQQYALHVYGSDEHGNGPDGTIDDYNAKSISVFARPINANVGGAGTTDGMLWRDGAPTTEWPYGGESDIFGFVSGDCGNNHLWNYGARLNYNNKDFSPWSGLFAQSFRASGEGLASVVLPVSGLNDPYNTTISFQLMEGGVDGTQIGPTKQCKNLIIHAYEEAAAAAWAPGEVTLIPGHEYFLRVDLPGALLPLMVDSYDGGNAYVSHGTPFPEDDLFMSIQEWGNISGQPSFTPTLSPTVTPTPTAAPRGPNLLNNPGAEDSDTQLTGWTIVTQDAGEIEVNKMYWHPESEQGANGTSNWFGVGTMLGGTHHSVMSQTLQVDIGQEYQAEAFLVTGADYTGGARAQVRMYVANGSASNWESATLIADTGTTPLYRDWTLFRGDLNFVPYGTTATVFIVFTSSGTEWTSKGMHADEIYFGEVGGSHPTPTPPPASPIPSPTMTVVPVATATPTIGCTFHSADLTGDWQIDFQLALLLIQRFNLGGDYSCGDQADGYKPGIGDRTSCSPHDTDYNQNWILDFPEMLRFIQFFNMGYHCTDDPNSPDGYAPGPG